MNGLLDAEVLRHPPSNDEELENLADTVTDHVVAVVQLPREQRRSAWFRWREARRRS